MAYICDREGVFSPGVQLLLLLPRLGVEKVDLPHLGAGDDVFRAG